MIFPNLNYYELTASDFKNYEAWVNAVNTAQKYCSTLVDIFEFVGKCEPSDLPSFHPYWSIQVDIKRRERNTDILRKLDLCEENPELYKVYFGRTADKNSVLQLLQ